MHLFRKVIEALAGKKLKDFKKFTFTENRVFKKEGGENVFTLGGQILLNFHLPALVISQVS